MTKRTDGTYALVFGDSSKVVLADRVVLCLPFTTLRDVDLSRAGFTTKRMRAIRELGMGTNAKLLMQFRDRLPTFHHWNGEVIADAPQNWSWDSTVNEGGRGGIFTMFTGGRTGAGYPTDVPHAPAPSAVVDDALGFLDRWLPGIRASFNGDAWLDSWVDDPWVKGSYAAFLPGQWTDFWGYLGRREGSVHFAGEHTSTYAQGYLDGGVETGQRAAREILQAIGRSG
jgi:monoamine oxidase